MRRQFATASTQYGTGSRYEMPHQQRILERRHRFHNQSDGISSVGVTSIRCGRRVVSGWQYHENAQECLGWARTAHSEREREIFLQIARTWLEAAERAAKKDCQSISATKMSLEPPTEPTRPSK